MILDGINNADKVTQIVINHFTKSLKQLSKKEKLNILSVSAGTGRWDYITLKNLSNINKLIATDISDKFISIEDISLLKNLGNWNFVKVDKEKGLPFETESMDLIYHHDVIEHVENPYQFINDQYRILKKEGLFILGTPNLFRLTNIFKILTGKLQFPYKLGEDIMGDCIHIQEFYEQQIKMLLKENNFKNIKIVPCYFGINALNLLIKEHPKTQLGKTLCQYLLITCRK